MRCAACQQDFPGDRCRNPTCARFANVLEKQIFSSLKGSSARLYTGTLAVSGVALSQSAATFNRVQANLELVQQAMPHLPAHAQAYLRNIFETYADHEPRGVGARRGGQVAVARDSSGPNIIQGLLQLKPNVVRRILVGLNFMPRAARQDMSPRALMTHLSQLATTTLVQPGGGSRALIARNTLPFMGPIIGSWRQQQRQESYERISGGALWNEYHRRMQQMPWYPFRAQSKSPLVEDLSRLNIKILRFGLGKLSDVEELLVKAIKALPFQLIHNTKYIEEMERNRTIFSKVALQRMGKIGGGESEIRDNSSGEDEVRLGNIDSVFFRFSPAVGPTSSRFGGGTLLLDPDTNGLYEYGWISLYDMLAPVHPSIRNVCWDGRQLLASGARVCRRSADEWIEPENTKLAYFLLDSGVTPELQDRILHFYPGRGPYIDELAQLVFYGPDILDGIALAVVRELRRMSITLSARHCADTDFVARLVSRLYRPEAKLPGMVQYDSRTVYLDDDTDDGASVVGSASSADSEEKSSTNFFMTSDDSSDDSSDDEDGEPDVMTVAAWLRLWRS